MLLRCCKVQIFYFSRGERRKRPVTGNSKNKIKLAVVAPVNCSPPPRKSSRIKTKLRFLKIFFTFRFQARLLDGLQNYYCFLLIEPDNFLKKSIT